LSSTSTERQQHAAINIDARKRPLVWRAAVAPIGMEIESRIAPPPEF
jgi:hypothetical protein